MYSHCITVEEVIPQPGAKALRITTRIDGEEEDVEKLLEAIDKAHDYFMAGGGKVQKAAKVEFPKLGAKIELPKPEPEHAE